MKRLHPCALCHARRRRQALAQAVKIRSFIATTADDDAPPKN
jgi:hypothetical protein